MRSHQDIGLEGHGAQMRRCSEQNFTDFFKLQEIQRIRKDHQGAEGPKHGQSRGHKTWAVLSTGPTLNHASCDDLKRFRGGGACDSSRPVIVGAGAVSRYFLLV